MIEKNTWWVYMVRCSDGTLYAGNTNDLEKRIEAQSKSAAAKLEYRIKRVPRIKKKGLARGEG